MTNLSVNINKVATIRNARGGNMPDLLKFAKDCETFGADGITVHPRPDERHIRYADVYNLKPLIKTELNIEGYPSEKFVDLVLTVKPNQVTLVPDAPNAITSNEGWDVATNFEFLSELIDQFKENGIRTSIFVGTDLNRMAGELEKLIITLPAGQKRITAEQIERNIGISKDYNNFELRNALIEKDVFKANQIVKYFEDNPKNNPLQVTLAVLFNFFSNLMLAYYAPDKSDQGIASQLGLRSPWQAKDYMAGMRKYTGVKVMQIIGAIRTCDAKSKGIDNPSTPDGELLRELVYFILH